MSRIGKKPINIPPEVTTDIKDGTIDISGPKGTLMLKLHSSVTVARQKDHYWVKVKDAKLESNLAGLYRTLLQNAILGVTVGWEKALELVGIGFRAQTTGTELTLNLGFSHPVIIKAPQGITFKVTENKVIVMGIDKYLVGEIAANIRRAKPPEPYKGKGIRYIGEYIRKKLGKAAKAVGGAPAK